MTFTRVTRAWEVGVFTRILLPTDFSASADAALAVALAFAERCDAELHVLHNLAWLDAEDDRRAVEAAAKARLDAALDRHRGKDDQFRVIKRTVVGVATATSILEYVAQEDIQLVVMGTHGRGLLHLLVGSVAEEVVRLKRRRGCRARFWCRTIFRNRPIRPWSMHAH
jgi:nucleotide-binding universal stress UspA family protein